jgi:DNA-binding NtrC family response regulator
VAIDQRLGTRRSEVAAPRTRSDDPPASFSRHAEGVTLLVVDGPGRGASVRVGSSSIQIGSEASCDLVVDDAAVSRRHLRASWLGRCLVAEDLGSRNGSFVGDVRFQRVEVGLGGLVRIGHSVLKVLPCEEILDPVESERGGYSALVGDAPAMRKLFTMIEAVAPAQAPVLIEGETGTGKELVAEELHRRSPRRDRPFVVLDCGAASRELIESTLFGHERGAFTGAVEARRGLFAEADGGTVFLDEISELQPGLQPALLRVVDRGEIRPVGASTYQRVDVRIIAACNQSLAAQVAAGRFREDLYYRLSVVRLSLPPLRERRGDIPTLIRHLLCRLGRPDVRVDDALMERLAAHTWGGNVRELRNIIESAAVLLGPEALLGPEHVPELADGPGPGGKPGPAPIASPLGFRDENGARIPFTTAKAAVLAAFERAYLGELVAEHDTCTSAAGSARMDRKYLRDLLRRHGLDL